MRVTLAALDDDNYFAAVVEAADDAIICSDRDGCITTWNRAAQRMLGYAPVEIIGRDISVLFPPEGQHEEAAALVQIWNGEKPAYSDRAMVRKDGLRVDRAWRVLIRLPARALRRLLRGRDG